MTAPDPAIIPGVFRCAKCNFTLVQSTLNAHDGTVTARDAPGDKCPHDGSPMWRVTYAEQLAEAHEEWGKQVERAAEAERQRDALLEAVTPSASTKAAYMGEFSMKIAEVDEHGEEYMRNLNVPWTTIKAIMEAIAARAKGATS